MANPVLTREFAPEHVQEYRGTRAPTASDTMTVGGVIGKTLALFAIVCVAGAIGYSQVDTSGTTVSFPGWLFVPMLAGLGLVLLIVFVPKAAPVAAPIYAACQGVVVGAISAVYESQWDGIVLQAVLCTAGVFFTMLVLFTTETIRVTPKLRLGIILATAGIFVAYLVTFLLSLFGVDVPFIHDSGPIGILISVVIVGVAAFNLLLDFDFIQYGVRGGMPRLFEWYAAFGLLVTLIWLYLEMLRLLAKLRQ